MLQSHVIDIDGAFVGAAVRLDKGYRFIATDIKLDELDGSIWPTLADVQRVARRIYLGGRVAYPARAELLGGRPGEDAKSERVSQLAA
jgi:hypothetical protein